MEDLNVTGKIILKWVCERTSSGTGQRPTADFYEHGNETSCSVKGGKFGDNLILGELCKRQNVVG